MTGLENNNMKNKKKNNNLSPGLRLIYCRPICESAQSRARSEFKFYVMHIVIAKSTMLLLLFAFLSQNGS